MYLKTLFDALDSANSGSVSRQRLENSFRKNGLHPRLRKKFLSLLTFKNDGVDFTEFSKLAKEPLSIKALQANLTIPDWELFIADVFLF